MPTLNGTQGDDVLTGTSGDDIIDGSFGDDIINAGGGNDTIIDGGGSDTIDSGIGDDFIRVTDLYGSIYNAIDRTKLIYAGDGGDVVEVSWQAYQGSLSVDLGSGADLLTFSFVPYDFNAAVTTGAGADRIVMDTTAGSLLGTIDSDPIVITDFTAGAGGDVLDIGEAVQEMLKWNPHAANPFADGHLVLVQDGADVIVRVEFFGGDFGPNFDRDLLRLENVNAANLTAYNFAGYDPGGADLVHNLVNGTSASEWLSANGGGSDLNGLSGNDRLTGNIGDDNLSGGAGSDILSGGSGNDTLDGGTENDKLDGGAGNDLIQGGDGDDVLTDPSGADTFDGGAGNDTIEVVRVGDSGPVTIITGDGNDYVHFDNDRINHTGGALTVDLGAGDDVFVVPNYLDTVELTLGTGHDTVVFGAYPASFVITDFSAGNAGDILQLQQGSVTNPFADGTLFLVQDGADTLVMSDFDGAGPQTYTYEYARLLNVDASSLTAFNFNGWAPDGSPSSFTIPSPTPGDDHLIGTAGADVIDGGNGNDLIEEFKSGNDTLNGGAGDDTIVLRHYVPWGGVENVAINGGTGNDTVDVSYGSSGHLSVDLGADNDRLVIHGLPNSDTNVTLGSGADVIELGGDAVSSGTPDPNHTILVTDFQTGNGGDRLDWATYIEQKNFNGSADYNPFLEGEARLVQVGGDVQLQVAGAGTHQTPLPFTTIMTFANTTVANFTAYNLGYNLYFPTQTGGGADDTLNGTSGADVLYGNGGNDTLNGNDGDDVIWGHDGTDTINGGIGNDFLRGGNDADVIHGDAGADNIDGGAGVDTLDGGDGDDRIADWFGVDTVIGGTGNDNLYVNLGHDSVAPVLGSLTAGDGNDIVEINNIYARTGYAVDLGAGDDTIIFDRYDFGPITLGTGRDTITGTPGSTVVVNDFETGDTGDILDLATMLGAGSIGYNLQQTGLDSFAAGYVQLKQVGTEVRLYVYQDGVNPTDLSVRFLNTDLSQFTSANFGGVWDPHATPNRIKLLSGDYTNNADRTFLNVTPASFVGSAAYMFSGGTGTLTNHASITLTNTIGFGGAVGISGGTAGGTFVNASDGELHVHYDYVPPNGDLSNGGFPTAWGVRTIPNVQNDGLFEVTAASGVAYGVQETSLHNTGTFTVTSAYDAYGLRNEDLSGFSNTGTISVHGDDFAVGLYFTSIHTSGLTNAGTITVTTDPSSPYGSIGIYMSETLAPPGGVFESFNSGTITADIAFFVENDHTTDLLGKDLLHNSGTMNGDVILSFGDDTVDNTGTIVGSVFLGAGDDHYAGAPGHNFGTVEGGTGNDEIVGGDNDDSLYGDEGADTIYGGLGDDFIEGGLGADTLYGQSGINDFVAYDESLLGVTVDLSAGTASDGIDVDAISGFEGVIGSRFDDSIRGGNPAETLLGGAGDDHIDGGAGGDTIRGEAGTDDLTGGAGNDKFLFSIGDGTDIIRDFTAGDKLQIYGYGAVSAVEQVGADVRVTLSATDQITLLNTTVATVQGGLIVSAFPLGDAFPVIDRAIIAANQDLIVPAGVTLAISDPADLHYRNLVLHGQGVLLGQVSSLTAGPNFFNAGTFNFIDSGQPQIVGVSKHYLYGSDQNTFVNEATGSILIENQGGDAIGIAAITQSFNYGTISVVAQGGDACGFTDLPIGFYFNNNFVNAGTLNVEATGQAMGMGQFFGSSDSIDRIFNSGTISVHGDASAIGINWFAPPGSAFSSPFLVNSGTIIATDNTAAKDSVALAAHFRSNATLWNSGTLQGDYAIKFPYPESPFLAGTLSIYNSGQMIGDVDFTGSASENVFLLNTGSITGNVILTNANDTFDGRTGQLTGPLSGKLGNDMLLTGAGSQTILGDAGDDTLSGGAGSDTLTGGQGADHFRFEAGFGIDTITDFDAAADHIDVRGYAAWQSIVQQGGDVVVTFAAGEQLLFKNQLVANLTAGLFTFGAPVIAPNTIPAAPVAPDAPPMPLPAGTPNQIYGTAAANTLNGTNANDALSGIGGNDTLNGSGGNDRLDGGTGNDTLNGGSGADVMFGGVGNDTYVVDNAADVVTENPGEGTDTVQSSIAYLLGSNLENLTLTGSASVSGTGNALANTIRGNSGDNTLSGGAGDDTLIANAGNDTLVGGAGYNRMYGGLGDDTYYANDVDDYAYENVGEGHDTVIASLDHQLRDNVEDLILTGSAFIGKGNAGDNSITGTDLANKLYGYEGNDALSGQGGDDYLFGAEGNDTMTGGAGYDRMYGGIGNDIYYVNDATDYAYENLGEGNDRVIASINHTLRANIEEVEFTGSADLRGYGNAENNLMLGNSGGNLLYGRDGNDTIKGNAGADILYGENGNDTLEGGSGLDRFYGGTGADTFLFRDGDFAGMTSGTADRIHDFSQAEGDKLDFSAVDASTLLGGDQGFAFIGGGAFTHTAGELRTYQSAGNTYVAGDTNGDGVADFAIRIDGLHTLQSSDFVL